MPKTVQVLVIANRTAASAALLEAVGARARRGPASFHLVVPASPRGLHRVVDPEDFGREAAESNLATALPKLCEAAGSEVHGHVGDSNPLSAIQDALNLGEYDEIILSTFPPRVSRWLRIDLVSKVRDLGVPLTHVESGDAVEGGGDATAEAASA